MNVGRIRFPIRVGKGQPGSGIRFGFRWPVGPLARRRPTRTLRRPTRPFVFSDPRASRWPTRGCVGRPGLLRFPIRGCVGRPAFPDTTVGRCRCCGLCAALCYAPGHLAATSISSSAQLTPEDSPLHEVPPALLPISLCFVFRLFPFSGGAQPGGKKKTTPPP